MPAVSDSSPLIFYAAIDRLDLLHEVYGDVVVPPAVWDEIVVEGAGRIGSAGVQARAWIGRRPLPAPVPGDPPIRGLDRGETQVIILAQSYPPTVSVLLDDLEARKVAAAIGLRVTGSVGVLLAAKRTGVIPTVRPLLARLREAGLYLDDAVAARALSLVGED